MNNVIKKVNIRVNIFKSIHIPYFETVPSWQNTPNCSNLEWVSKPKMVTTEIVTAGAKRCLEK